jgi:ribosomal protein S25
MTPTSNPAVQNLIQKFTADISSLSRRIVLETIQQSFARQKVPNTVKKSASRPLPPVNMRPEADDGSVPPVSKEVKELVATTLLTMPKTGTKELAAAMGLKERLVRHALKHLEQEGVVKSWTEGGRKLFFDTV